MELVLCRDVYHCTPDRLQEIPLQTLLDHLTCLDVEAAVSKRRRKRGRRGG